VVVRASSHQDTSHLNHERDKGQGEASQRYPRAELEPWSVQASSELQRAPWEPPVTPWTAVSVTVTQSCCLISQPHSSAPGRAQPQPDSEVMAGSL
jgi:hypothetical protein